ncbi:MAG TPA: SpoIID/LytB domain-containing protein [Gemmatimonadaceae bacterium]|nr:SpoIID/LytB domain-containing protein [Gemmatimonadaceae bacterium]
MRVAVLVAAAGLACSRTAGPVRPAPGVGLPVDPTTVPESTATPAAPPGVPVERPAEPEDRPPPTRLPGNVSRAAGARTIDAPVTDVQRLSRSARGPSIRVLTGTHANAVTFEVSSSWIVERVGEEATVAKGGPGRAWRIERSGTALRVVRGDGAATPYRRGVLELRPAEPNGVMAIDRTRYRGVMRFHATSAGILAVDHLSLEEYLTGVVPLEIGRTRTMSEIAAVEAQAVAARSYTVTRLGNGGTYDLRSTTADQVYGGVAAETPVAIRAVLNTRGLVLRYGDRTVNAPYHSTCGGTTAEAPEAWNTRGEPFLQRVSDRIPGTDRDYCEPSPRYRWTKTISAEALDAAVARHLGAYQRAAAGPPGAVRAVRVASTTASGRVGTAVIQTTRGDYTLRGNDARYVLRQPGGEILNSSYFSVRGPADGRGGVVLEGRGYGHGVGMCQWGAIGRARAGQDFRTILQTYFPGTTVGPAR